MNIGQNNRRLNNGTNDGLVQEILMDTVIK
ncbi:hypothetical protein ACUXOR_002369 [Staphylococcus pasteuri]